MSAGNTPDKQKFVWRWKKGAVTDVVELETAVSSRGYSMCMYDGDDLLLMSAKAPTTGTCGTAACWSRKSDKFHYKDKKLTRTGTNKVLLKPGEAGKASIKVEGKGSNVGVPSLPISVLPLTVQLITHEGDCWGSTFSEASKNDASKLKATSD